jgi:hypothetical protein
MKYKVTAILLVILLSIGLANTQNHKQVKAKASMRPIRAALMPTIVVTNNYYDLTVEDLEGGRGTYTVCTGDSHPATIQMGSKQNVLYGGAGHSPWSTYLSIKSYNSHAIYVSTDDGPTPDPGYTTVDIGPYGAVTQQSATEVLTSWTLTGQPDSLKIDQLTYIVGTTLDDSRIAVLTKIKNLGSASAALGMRYEWDIMIDGNDGATTREKNPQGQWLVNETEWASISFTHYEITDDSLAPTFYNLGSVIGPAYFQPMPSQPDLLQFADWPSSYGTAFSYAPTGQYIYDDDSAILYYWGSDSTNAIVLAPGDSVAVVQYLFASLISFEYQVDNLIKNSFETDYIGNNIYNTTGDQQTKNQSVLPNNAAIYHVKIENDGNGEDGFTVTGPAGGSGWNIAYYDELVGGNNITSQVTGSGWPTGGLNPGENKEIRVEVTPDLTVPSGNSLDVLILSTSQANNQKQDAVKTVTTVLPAHDVGVTEILAPAGTILEGTVVTPTSVVKNFGNNSETFLVKFDFGTYSDSVEVTLDAGIVDTLEFTPWTAVLGSYNTISYSMLDGDENPTNDTAYGAFEVVSGVIHDVGVTAILAPIGTIPQNTSVTPSVTVENFGNQTETFPVTFEFNGYSNTQTVTDLAPGATATVNFDLWTAVVGSYNTVAYTALVGDEDMTNDTAYGSFVVESLPGGHDVGVIEIIEPVGTILAGTVVSPTAVIQNFGNFDETFPCYFIIGCAYYDWMIVTLPISAVDTIVFAPWTTETGFYNEAAETGLENDENDLNDRILLWLTVTPPSYNSQENKVAAPLAFALAKPYPNPARENLSLRFSVPRTTKVEIAIYDINGRTVKVLLSETKTAGFHNLNVNCQDIPNGAYILRMTADNYSAIEKFTLTK